MLDWLILLAFVAGTRLIARSLIERPGAASLIARGKEVIVVGAGDAAQLVVREMLKAPGLGYTPIGLIDDDPRKKNIRLHGIRVLGTTDDLPHILRDNPPDEVLIAIPSASGETRQRVVEIAQDANVPVKTLPGLYELISGDLNLAGPDPSRPGRGRARPRAGRGRRRLDRRVPRRRDRARHRRRRVDRRGALPPDRAGRARPGSCSSSSPRRRSSTSSASSSASVTSRPSPRFSATAATARR